MMRPPAVLSASSFSAVSANSKISAISSLVKSAIESKFRRGIVFLQANGAAPLPVAHGDLVDAVRLFEHNVDPPARPGVDILTDDIGPNRQLPPAAIPHRPNPKPFFLSPSGA